MTVRPGGSVLLPAAACLICFTLSHARVFDRRKLT